MACNPTDGKVALKGFRSGESAAEGRGISPEVLALCDERVTIPQRGATQSLNLGVAVGIVLYEAVRQGRGFGRAPKT